MNVTDGIAIASGEVAVSSWGTLEVLDLATGKTKFKVGE